MQGSVVLTAVIATFYTYVVTLANDRLPYITLEVTKVIAIAPLVEGAIHLLCIEFSLGLVAIELKER